MTIAKVIQREVPREGLPNRYVEIVRFQTDICISGIAPYGEDLMILGVSDQPDPEVGVCPPFLAMSPFRDVVVMILS